MRNSNGGRVATAAATFTRTGRRSCGAAGACHATLVAGAAPRAGPGCIETSAEENADEQVHSPREHFHSYLHSLDIDLEGLPESFPPRKKPAAKRKPAAR